MTTFSTSLKLELIGDGQQSGTWGQTTNKNLGTLLEQAITGVQAITMLDTNYTLTNLNGISDEARNPVLVISGTNSAIRDVIAPLVNKQYIVINRTTGGYAIRIRGASGTSVTVPNGMAIPVTCDSTNFYTTLNGTSGDFAINGNEIVTGTLGVTGAISGTTATFSGAISSVSPSFSGTPTAPTAVAGTSTTQIATTAFVQNVAGALGTMSSQNANNVAITGGTVSGVSGSNPSMSVGSATNSTNATNATYATTQSTGTANTTIATTAFVNPGTSFGGYFSGYNKFASGLILQWGLCPSSGTTTFPIAFPNACVSVNATPNYSNSTTPNINAITNTAFGWNPGYQLGGAYYMAIGY